MSSADAVVAPAAADEEIGMGGALGSGKPEPTDGAAAPAAAPDPSSSADRATRSRRNSAISMVRAVVFDGSKLMHFCNALHASLLWPPWAMYALANRTCPLAQRSLMATHCLASSTAAEAMAGPPIFNRQATTLERQTCRSASGTLGNARADRYALRASWYRSALKASRPRSLNSLQVETLVLAVWFLMLANL